MLAAALKDVDRIAVEEVPDPEPGPTQVVVNVKACGTCATDHKAVRGKRAVRFPRILGHEISGVIARARTTVEKWKPGDKVIVSPRGYCGPCEPCRSDLHHYGEETFSTGGDGCDRFLPGGHAHFMETRMDASFSVTPLAMQQATRRACSKGRRL